MSQRLVEQLTVCKVADNIKNNSDHNPIQTLVDIETLKIEPIKRRN